MTALMATFSAAMGRCRMRSSPTVSEAARPAAWRHSTTRSSVGGTIGKPSVQPFCWYNSFTSSASARSYAVDRNVCRGSVMTAPVISRLLSLSTSGIAPVNGTELRIDVVVLEAHPIPSFGPQNDRVAHLRLFEFEPLGQHDACAVLFAGHRVLDWLGLDLPHVRNAHHGAATLTVHLNVDGGNPGLQDGGIDDGENFPDRPAVASAVECQQRLALGRGGVLVDDHVADAIALMDGTWPPENARESHTIELGMPEMSLADL